MQWMRMTYLCGNTAMVSNNCVSYRLHSANHWSIASTLAIAAYAIPKPTISTTAVNACCPYSKTL